MVQRSPLFPVVVVTSKTGPASKQEISFRWIGISHVTIPGALSCLAKQTGRKSFGPFEALADSNGHRYRLCAIRWRIGRRTRMASSDARIFIAAAT